MKNTKLLKTDLLELNKGQIKGLPKNPRFIRDVRYERLKKSIEDAPEMLEMRELIVVEHDGRYVVICGNMRLRACFDLGYTELPCYILPATTPVEKLREYTIKDNIGFGQTDWDIIEEEWNKFELEDWGMELEDWSKDVTTAFDTATAGYGQGDATQPYVGGQTLVYGESGGEQGGGELPPGLRGLDITPGDLPKVEGDDAVAMERIIIVYPKERTEELAKALGIGVIDKVIYNIDELTF